MWSTKISIFGGVLCILTVYAVDTTNRDAEERVVDLKALRQMSIDAYMNGENGVKNTVYSETNAQKQKPPSITEGILYKVRYIGYIN